MSEACTEIDARLEALANAAALLGSRLPRVRDPGSGLWMAHGMDTLLRNRLCAAHHLYVIHGGRMRVTGTAPDKLDWEFGLRRSYVAAA